MKNLRGGRSTVLGLAFLAAAGGFTMPGKAQENPAPAPVAEPAHTYWKVKEYEAAVIDVWRCPETGVCMKVRDIDPQDAKMRKLAARALHKKEGAVTDGDVRQFCGYRAELEDVHPEPGGDQTGRLGKWSGKFRLRVKGLPGQTSPDGAQILPLISRVGFTAEETFNAKATPPQQIHIHGYLGFIPIGSLELTPVGNPPPACQSPAKAVP